MPWHIVEEDDQFCVVKDDDETVEGCHDTQAEAEDQLAALYAAEGETPPAAATGTSFTLFIVVEGVETSDHRLFELDALTPRAVLPVPLMFQNRAEHGGFGGDTTATFVGAINEVFRDEREPSRWLGRGQMLDTDFARDAETQIRGGLRGVSVDATADEVTYDVRSVSAEDGWPVDVLARFDRGTIMGATVTPHPAFEVCTIWFADEEEPDWVAATAGADIPLTDEPEQVDDGDTLLLLASAGGPQCPPADWFDDPALDCETPLTVTADGRLFGHVAPWRTCHLSNPDVCISAPTSPAAYAYFHTGEVEVLATDNGDIARLAVGQITLGAGHADERLGSRGAIAHYDNTASVVADIRVGEDDYGIWCAGAVRPGIDDAAIRALMAAKPSGDWRRINGALELVAVLAVNVPGFPIPRPKAYVAAGVQTTLVAAAAPGFNDPAVEEPSLVVRLAARIDQLERALNPLLVDAKAKAVERATASIRAKAAEREAAAEERRRAVIRGRSLRDIADTAVAADIAG